MTNIFLDADGVIADFTKRWFINWPMDAESIRQVLGKKAMWDIQKKIDPDFFEELELMPDAMELYEGVKHLNPIILTGSPAEWGYLQKFKWGQKYFPNVPMIVCKSKEKHFFCEPGDILIDDRTKYQSLWEEAGGRFIVHTSAKESLAALRDML